MGFFKPNKRDQEQINTYLAETFIEQKLPIPSAYTRAVESGQELTAREARKLLIYTPDEQKTVITSVLDEMLLQDDPHCEKEKLKLINKIISVNVGTTEANHICYPYNTLGFLKDQLKNLFVGGYIAQDSYNDYLKVIDQKFKARTDDTRLRYLDEEDKFDEDEYRSESKKDFFKEQVETETEGDPISTVYIENANKFLEKKQIPEYKNNPSLEDLIGMTSEKQTLLMKPFVVALYADPGEKVSTNPVILLDGAPGTGKSYTMLAIANEIGANIEVVNAPSYKDQYVGNTEKNFNKIIKKGISMFKQTGKPSIIQIDEAEVMFPHKTSDAHSVEKSVMAMFNSYTDGPQKSEIEGKVFFVLTVNQKAAIDPSVLSRAEIIHYDKPSVEELEKLLIQQTVGRYMKVDFENVNWAELARMSEGFVQRDIKKIGESVKTLALDREAEKKQVKLHKATKEEREQIRENYMISHEDFETLIVRTKNTTVKKTEPGNMFG